MPRIYAAQTAAFPDSKAIDGYGLADSLEAMARIALEQAPTTDFDLFGHSMGGRVALEVFRLAPRTRAAPRAAVEHRRPFAPRGRAREAPVLLDIARDAGHRGADRCLAPADGRARRLNRDEALMDADARRCAADAGQRRVRSPDPGAARPARAGEPAAGNRLSRRW